MATKALILFSGGLDSRLALRIMKDLLGEKNVESIFFLLPFGSGCCNEHCALNFSQKELTKLTVVDCTKGKLLQEYLEIIKKPKHNTGTAMNPCKDCKIFMFKKAKEYADKNKIELIVTGEVLNERPMSQTKKALSIIEEETGLKGRLLRPLSAKLLEETTAEKEGRIDREKFLDIQGRQRKKQIELANKYQITYPNPAGGCLLCEKDFCEKLKPLLKGKIEEIDVHLLKLGRHFDSSSIILGKNHGENEKLAQLRETFKQGIIIIPKQPGPTAFIKNQNHLEKAKELIKKHSKHEIKEFKVLN